MLYIRGSQALSHFRIERLLSKVKKYLPSKTELRAEYVYFAQTEQKLTPDEIKRLERLLIGEQVNDIQIIQPFILVVPRFGTISPWSSKATDIVHLCGISAISRIEKGIVYSFHGNESKDISQKTWEKIADALHDQMTETASFSFDEVDNLFQASEPRPFISIDILNNGKDELARANKKFGMAMSDDEIDYLYESFLDIGRNPTDVELMMFAQANSEHCRHKIFNADWIIDGKPQTQTLFGMIRNTAKRSPKGLLSAYKDNAAVIEGQMAERFFAEPANKKYCFHAEPVDILVKVETHNHPTAIAPDPGAATGAGGEIRDEGATGRGAKPKAGLVGFSVSNLRIPGYEQPWEIDYGKPPQIASALDIMIQGPIGAAAYNNEFGRPNLCGYFRAYEQRIAGLVRGYHKPIMIAGGMGNIRRNDVEKQTLPANSVLIVLGGPAMLIGLGGGAASSVSAGSLHAELDFASVQRANAEMQRRCQEVIDQCWALGEKNPIISIHDVGAGGLANAIPELVHDSARGARVELRAIPNSDFGMSPMEIWCNESQERYVLGIERKNLDLFAKIAERERCLFAVVGDVTQEETLIVSDSLFDNTPINLSMETLFGKPPKMLRDVRHQPVDKQTLSTKEIVLEEAIQRVLSLPAVASKNFLITIGDRTVGGLVVRDQMVGPWQVPVADVAVTASGFTSYHGEAMAMGERTPCATQNPAAAARLAVAEAITNLAAANIVQLSDIRLSANWMAAAGFSGEDANLFDAVKAVGMELCPELGIAIPVGKDSLSMRMTWKDDHAQQEVVAPLSLIISGFAPVLDVRKTLTPQLNLQSGETDIFLIDLSCQNQRLAGSALAQVYELIGEETPDLDDPTLLKNFFTAIQEMNQGDLLLAYHDRSDGGLLATLTEMAFAGHCGLDIQLKELGTDPVAILFNEELGAVIQTRRSDRNVILQTMKSFDLMDCCHLIGEPTRDDQITFYHDNQVLFKDQRHLLQKTWSQTSYHIQRLRDNPICADQELQKLDNVKDPGLWVDLSFSPKEMNVSPYINKGVNPKVAILRDQGVNGQVEMAAAFTHAGFEAIDVHMTDIINGRVALKDFHGLAACGGFSYGDVLGAGRGWASTILYNSIAQQEFYNFFNRNNTFTLGACNGCQMLAQLKDLIPGAQKWPIFTRNKSEQYEARLVMVDVPKSPSILFQGMIGSKLPIVVAHGEGKATWEPHTSIPDQLTCLQYIDENSKPTERYPYNPNGSPQGIAGVTSEDGRVTILMPHPERLIRTINFSWYPNKEDEFSPWLKLFVNAKEWLK